MVNIYFPWRFYGWVDQRWLTSAAEEMTSDDEHALRFYNAFTVQNSSCQNKLWLTCHHEFVLLREKSYVLVIGWHQQLTSVSADQLAVEIPWYFFNDMNLLIFKNVYSELTIDHLPKSLKRFGLLSHTNQTTAKTYVLWFCDLYSNFYLNSIQVCKQTKQIEMYWMLNFQYGICIITESNSVQMLLTVCCYSIGCCFNVGWRLFLRSIYRLYVFSSYRTTS